MKRKKKRKQHDEIHFQDEQISHSRCTDASLLKMRHFKARQCCLLSWLRISLDEMAVESCLTLLFQRILLTIHLKTISSPLIHLLSHFPLKASSYRAVQVIRHERRWILSTEKSQLNPIKALFGW